MVRALNVGSVNLPTANFPPLAAFQIPHAERLAGAFFLGHGAEIATIDWSDNADAEIMGNPVFHDGYATLSGDGYIQANVAETEAMTYVIIGRKTAEGQVGWIGNHGGSAAAGVSMYSNAFAMSATTGRTGGAANINLTSDMTSFGIFSLQAPASSPARLAGYTTGTANTGGAGSRVVNGAGKIRIGRLYSSGFVGECDVMAALIFGSALSNTEVTEVANHLREYAAGMGVTV